MVQRSPRNPGLLTLWPGWIYTPVAEVAWALWALYPVGLGPGIQGPKVRQAQWACPVLWAMSPRLGLQPALQGWRPRTEKPGSRAEKHKFPRGKNPLFCRFVVVERQLQPPDSFDFRAGFSFFRAGFPSSLGGLAWGPSPRRPMAQGGRQAHWACRALGPQSLGTQGPGPTASKRPGSTGALIHGSIRVSSLGILGYLAATATGQGRKKHTNTKDFFGMALPSVFWWCCLSTCRRFFWPP